MKWLTNKEIEKKYEKQTKFKHKCKCGHTEIIANPRGYVVCSHCRNLVFKDKETEFKYRLKEKISKEKRNLKNER